MDIIQRRISDREGNHLLIALEFYDKIYKTSVLNIPEEFSEIEIVDIVLEKEDLNKPLNPFAFFQMTEWLISVFQTHQKAIFTYICSTDPLENNHKSAMPSDYRWSLFDRLWERTKTKCTDLHVQDIFIGIDDEFQTKGRAFYRTQQAPLIHIITNYLREK